MNKQKLEKKILQYVMKRSAVIVDAVREIKYPTARYIKIPIAIGLGLATVKWDTEDEQFVSISYRRSDKRTEYGYRMETIEL